MQLAWGQRCCRWAHQLHPNVTLLTGDTPFSFAACSASKGKTVPAMVFTVAKATRPLWGQLLPPPHVPGTAVTE